MLQIRIKSRSWLLKHGATFPQLAILINSAGISLAGRFLESTSTDFERVMDVNFGGVVKMTRAFLPHLTQQSQAHIVNIGSSFGLIGMPNKSAYCASKFAVRGFTETLQCELASTNVGLTLLLPGPVATRLLVDSKTSSPAQRQAEMAFVERRALGTERIARRTMRAIHRREWRVIIGLDYHVIDWASRLAPTLTLKIAARLTARLPF